MRDKILIIGGHGHVGNVIVKSLLNKGITQIVIGGRNKEKMKDYISKTHPSLSYRVMNVGAKITPAQLKDIRMVVMCLDQDNTNFVEQCMAERIDYVDISAKSEFMEKIHQLPASDKVSVVTHVGIAPGITNLMVKEYLSRLSQTEKEVAIDVILGIGDTHGKAAIEWTFSQMNSSYLLNEQKIESFTNERDVQYISPIGKKKTYHFNFADQHILRSEYPGVKVSTFLGFDIVFISKLLHYLKKWKLLHIFSSNTVITLLQSMMNKKLLGSDLYALKVSNGKNNDPNAIIVYGQKEAVATGEVAACIVRKLLSSTKKFGITSINAVSSLEEVLQEVSIIKKGEPLHHEKRLA